ncbi:MAG: type II toxin-antitoxin system HipA family toxin [Bacilli bacterium]|nr:type II toxin-antitoxin system HipA family toxin [Bacilli bacterium]
MITSLKVILWDEEIGRISWSKGSPVPSFQYNPKFTEKGLEIFPISAPLSIYSNRIIKGEVYNKLFQKLPPFLADCLPDDWGNLLFDQWRKSNNIKSNEITALDKLSFIGKRGMGALEFIPENSPKENLERLEIKSLIALANKVFLERENAKISPEESLSLQLLISLGTSVGGRQSKAVIAINDQTGEIHSGQTCDLPNFTHYILKFGDKEFTFAEIEMTYFQMAKNAGISIMDSKLLNIDGINHFLTKRFDRQNGEKLHTQTLLAMDEYAEDSYESFIAVCRKLKLSQTECEEVFRRMVFNILSNNTDDHKKNFSFLMNKKGEWYLSPAYDITFIIDNNGVLPNKFHCMSVNGKVEQISKSDVLSFAKENGIRHPDKIIKEVADSLCDFRDLAIKNGVKNLWVDRIDYCIQQHLCDWELTSKEFKFSYTNESDYKIRDAYLELRPSNNIHLYAFIEDSYQKFIFGKKSEECMKLKEIGLTNIKKDDISFLVDKYLVPKYERQHNIDHSSAKELLSHYKKGELDDNTLIVISSCFNESELDMLSDQLRDMNLIESKSNLTMSDESILEQIIEQGKELSETIIYKQLLDEPTIGRLFETIVIENLQDENKRQIIFSALDEYTSDKFIKGDKSIDYEGSIDLIKETIKKIDESIKIVDYDVLPMNIRNKRINMDFHSLTIVNDIVCEYHQIQTLRCKYEKSIKSFEDIETKYQSQASAKNPVFQQIYEKAKTDKDNKIADINATVSSMKYFNQEKLDQNISEEQSESQSRGMRR